MNKLTIMQMSLKSDKKMNLNAHLLRGFFATKFNEYELLHHHIVDKYLYTYPKIQYKIIDGIHTVIGINEGVNVLKDIYNKFNEIRLGNTVYNITENKISIQEEDFGVSEKFYTYDFITPWLALNNENYIKFNDNNPEDRQKMLNKILIGNFISTSKGLNYQVEKEIKCNINNYKPIIVKGKFKENVLLTAFYGNFTTNFLLPNYIGIGKSVSHGYGVIKILK